MIDKEIILTATDRGLDVFRHYLPPFELRKNFRSPFYDDRRPSCNVFFDKRHRCWRYHDFGDPSYSGDCFWLVGLLYGYDLRTHFVDVMKKISYDLSLGLFDPLDDDLSLRRALVDLREERLTESAEAEREDTVQPYSYASAGWDGPTLAYWSGYGISEATLVRYGVVALEAFSSYSRAGRPYTVRWRPREPLYGYDLGTAMKLYRPLSRRMRFLYAGRVPSPYLFGYDRLPGSGDHVILTGGEKDVLSLASRGYSALCLNSETKTLPEELVSDLAARFGTVMVMYDMDTTGVASSERIVSQYAPYGLRRVPLPLSGGKGDKDVSDLLRRGGDAALREAIDEVMRTE